MTHGAWLTPDSIPGAVTCRTLQIPDDPNIIAAVSGALLPLIYPSNWQQFGAVTPAQMATAMQVMFHDFLDSECSQGRDMSAALYEHRENQNVGGGSVTANADVKLPFTHEIHGEPWVTFDNVNDTWTLQAGRYVVNASHNVGMTSGASFMMLIFTSGFATLFGEQIFHAQDRWLRGVFYLESNEPETFSAYLRSSVTLANTGLGAPKNMAGQQERYGQLLITRLGDFE